MITQKKLRIYEKFNGDIDGFARGSSIDEQASITDQDWHLIDELQQGMTIIQSGAASAQFEAQIRQRLVDAAPDESVRERLRSLSKPKAGLAK